MYPIDTGCNESSKETKNHCKRKSKLRMMEKDKEEEGCIREQEKDQ